MRAPTTAPTTGPSAIVRPGDLVISLLLLGVFVLGYVYAQEWPFRAKLFPQMVCAAGAGLAVLKLAGFAAQALRGRRATPVMVSSAVVTGDPDNEEEEEDHSLEYIFGTAGRRAWAAALGWILAFFLSLWFLGVFVTVPLFALVYLRIAGNAGWLGAAIYAGVAGGVVWFVFGYVLAVPMPIGIF